MVQLSWDKIISKKVKSSDKKNLGDVESVATEYIEVKEGMVSKKHYYIPKYYIQGFDGDNLYTSLTKEEIKDRFERQPTIAFRVTNSRVPRADTPGRICTSAICSRCALDGKRTLN